MNKEGSKLAPRHHELGWTNTFRNSAVNRPIRNRLDIAAYRKEVDQIIYSKPQREADAAYIRAFFKSVIESD